MKRAVIYARYSSDLQTDASIEDQIRVNKERAKREGWEVTNNYTDHGISGASLIRRPGIQMLMQDASDRKFDIVIAEALDRLSRDQEDIAGIYKRLAFAGVKIITLSEGEINEMHIGLKGTMNALFLKDLADKTRRGQRGRVENGKSGGGNCYGYDIVKKFDANGEPVRGDRTINTEQAKIVNRIFKEFSIGKSPKAIASQLNKEGIAGPNAGTWGPSTIYGNRQRGTGILNNELYIGQLIWNRLTYVKDPDTGKRVSRMNPETSWVKKEVPEQRIVDQALWDKVKDKQGAIRLQHKEFWGRQRPKALFTGLMKCGCCGSGVTKVSVVSYGCFDAYNKGMCTNKVTIKQTELEELVLNALQKHLMNPELCKVFCDEYTSHMNMLRMQQTAQRAGHEAELKRRVREEDRLIQMVIDGVVSTHTVKDKINANSARIEVLKEILADKPDVPPLLHPGMGGHYQKEISKLVDSLNDAENRSEAIMLIRGLIEKIVLNPIEGTKELSVDLHGDLAGILTVASGKTKPLNEIETMADQVKMVAGACTELDSDDEPLPSAALLALYEGKLVAGVGFEPTTFRL